MATFIPDSFIAPCEQPSTSRFFDTIDLTAVNLDGGDAIANLIGNGFIGVVGNQLFVDLDGGAITGEGDDILVATFSDGGGGFNILTDVRVVDMTLTLGVTETGEFGNNFNGQTDADGVVTATFTGTSGDLLLSFKAYDIDSPIEVEVLLDGASLGFLPMGVNEGLTEQSFMITAAQQTNGVESVISFVQSENVDNTWGVTDVLLFDIA